MSDGRSSGPNSREEPQQAAGGHHGAPGSPQPGQPPPDWDERGKGKRFADALRNRTAVRRSLSVLSVVLLLAGAGMFAYPFATNFYTEQFLQQPLRQEFSTPDFRQQYATEGANEGQPVTRISIPAIGVETMVVEGTSMAALRAGAGHYPTTPLPGEEGNVAIAGHRTTYGRPFNRLNEVPVGSKVILETPLAKHTYQVVQAPADAGRPCPNGACWITQPNDWSVVRQMDGSHLTLTTCHPKGSAARRLILRARLVGSVPLGDTAAADTTDDVAGSGRFLEAAPSLHG